jgi:hypothetical protein
LKSAIIALFALRGRLAGNPTPKQVQKTELHLKAIELGFESDNPGMRQFYASIRMADGTVDQNRAFSDLMRLATNPTNYTNLLEELGPFVAHLQTSRTHQKRSGPWVTRTRFAQSALFAR